MILVVWLFSTMFWLDSTVFSTLCWLFMVLVILVVLVVFVSVLVGFYSVFVIVLVVHGSSYFGCFLQYFRHCVGCSLFLLF